MVVTEVQDYIAAGQVRPTDLLIDPLQAARPGTITVFMEPMFKGGFENIPPGSQCIANAYTNNHERLADPNIGTGQWLFLHVVDTVALVHAMIMRLRRCYFRCRRSFSPDIEGHSLSLQSTFALSLNPISGSFRRHPERRSGNR